VYNTSIIIVHHEDKLLLGKVYEILVPTDPSHNNFCATHIVIHLYEFLLQLHPKLHIPCLILTEYSVVIALKVCNIYT
jgi:hypothetical protein